MKFKHSLIFVCYSLLVGFLLTESALWLFFPTQVTFESNKILHNTIAGLKNEYTYHRDANGFRSLSMRTSDKPPNTIRILCLGASTTDQSTQSTADIWSGILENRLNSKFDQSGLRIEVAARGFGGETVVDVLRWAKENALKYEPDLVILLLGINDLCWLGGPDYRFTTTENALRERRSVADLKPGSWRLIIQKYSQTYRRLLLIWRKYDLRRRLNNGQALEWHSSNIANLQRRYRSLAYVEKPERNPDPIIEFEDAHATLLQFLTDANINTIILSQPTLWKHQMDPDEEKALWFYVNTPQGPVRPSTSWLATEMKRYNQIQKSNAIKHDMAYIDLDRIIPKRLSYMFDDCHFTDLGNIKVAEAVAEVVEIQLRTNRTKTSAQSELSI